MASSTDNETPWPDFNTEPARLPVWTRILRARGRKCHSRRRYVSRVSSACIPIKTPHCEPQDARRIAMLADSHSSICRNKNLEDETKGVKIQVKSLYEVTR